MADVKGIPGMARRDRARATRHLIIRAATELFASYGYHGTTMAAIAKDAGVAVQTVYFVFHTKGELLGASIDEAVLGPEQPTRPDETEWWAAVIAEPKADKALRAFIAGSGQILARASAMSEVARTAAQTDPDARHTYDYHEKLRVEGYQQIVEILAGKSPLRDGLSVSEATDILVTLFGPATYLSLISERGWRHDQVIAWLQECLPELLLPPRRRARR